MLGAELNEILQYDLYVDADFYVKIYGLQSISCPSHLKNYHKLSHHKVINKPEFKVVDAQITSLAQSKVIQHQSERTIKRRVNTKLFEAMRIY